MFELIQDFDNYDLINENQQKKTKKNKNNNKNSFNFYFILNETIPTKLFLDPNKANIFKYDDLDELIISLKKGYNNRNEINNQFILDVSRSKLVINKHKTDSIEKAVNYIDYTYDKKVDNLKILCTQGIFAPLLEWISQSLPENFYVGELGLNKISNKLLIKILGNKITLNKRLRIFNIIDGEANTIRYLKIIINIDNYLESKTIDSKINFSKIIDCKLF